MSSRTSIETGGSGQPLLGNDDAGSDESHNLQDGLGGSGREYHQYRDLAATTLIRLGQSPTEHLLVPPDEETRIRRKTYRRIGPLLLALAFASHMTTFMFDRFMNLIALSSPKAGPARHNVIYIWVAFYATRLVLQLPASYALVRWPLNRVLGVSVLGSAILSALMRLLSHGPFLMIAAAMLKGGISAVIDPGIITVTQIWWRKREQTKVLGCVYIFMTLLRPLYILELFVLSVIGNNTAEILYALTGLCAVPIYFFLPNSPTEARGFTEEQKSTVIHSQYCNQMGFVSRTWRKDHFLEAVSSLWTWLLVITVIMVQIPSTGLLAQEGSAYRTPAHQSEGFLELFLGFYLQPVYLLAVIIAVVCATKSSKKSYVILALCIPPQIFLGLNALLPTSMPTADLTTVPLFLLTGCHVAITPILYIWSAQNAAGTTKRQTVTALVFMATSTGKLLGLIPFALSSFNPENFLVEHQAYGALFCGVFVLTMLLVCLLKSYNAERRKVHKYGQVKGPAADWSLLKYKQEYNTRIEAEAEATDQSDHSADDWTFMDATDSENPNFYYAE